MRGVEVAEGRGGERAAGWGAARVEVGLGVAMVEA